MKQIKLKHKVIFVARGLVKVALFFKTASNMCSVSNETCLISFDGLFPAEFQSVVLPSLFSFLSFSLSLSLFLQLGHRADAFIR